MPINLLSADQPVC